MAPISRSNSWAAAAADCDGELMPGDHRQPAQGCDTTHQEEVNPGWPFVYRCTDCNHPRWQEAFDHIPAGNLDRARQSLVTADSNGGFWKFNPTDKQVACHWLVVADGGIYGGELVKYAINQGWIPAQAGGSTTQTTTAGTTVNTAAANSVPLSSANLTAYAQANPMVTAGIVGLLAYLLTKR